MYYCLGVVKDQIEKVFQTMGWLRPEFFVLPREKCQLFSLYTV